MWKMNKTAVYKSIILAFKFFFVIVQNAILEKRKGMNR